VPQANFKTDPDQGTIVNPEIQITDLSSGADTLIYDLGDGSFSMMRNLANSYPDSGTFILRQTVWNTYGCRDTFIKKITIRYLFVFNTPTAFSPNDDGINDVYEPGGIGYTKYSMWIYNRWGEMIYETTEGKAWDGNYANEPVMSDVYAVRFKVKDFKGRLHFYSATFTLLR
jgi:gliding motility-associated-like protein